MNRYFPGRGSKEHLECTLTLSDYLKAEEELVANPPAEFFLAGYFRGKGWWERPDFQSASQALPPPPPQMSDEAFEDWERQFEVPDA